MENNSEIDYASFSIKGKSHKKNEDRSIMLGEKARLVKQAGRGQIFSVFDGMGSAPKGGEAAQYMCDALINFFKDKATPPTLKALVGLLFKANLDINRWGYIEGTKNEIGACAGTAIWITDDELYTYHVGDTCCLLLKADFQNEEEYEQLTTDQAIGNELLAFWGMGETLHIETWKLKIKEGDILVLFTDGVTKAIDFKTISKDVRKWILTSPEFAAESLCKKAERMGSTDDITAVVVEIIEIDI